MSASTSSGIRARMASVTSPIHSSAYGPTAAAPTRMSSLPASAYSSTRPRSSSSTVARAVSARSQLTVTRSTPLAAASAGDMPTVYHRR